MSKEKEKKQSNKTVSNKHVNTKKVTDSKNTKATKKETTVKEIKEIESDVVIEEEFDYNEDLEDELEEDFEEEVEEIEEDIEDVIVTKKDDSKSDKKSKKSETVDAKIEDEKNSIRIEKVPSKKNIEKIEKIAKEKKKKNKTNSKFNEFLVLFEKHHVAIFSFVGGVILTALIAFVIWPDRIATLKNGEQSIVKVDKENYTADELYEDMKNYYSVSLLLDNIDNDILTKMYPETDEMVKEVEASAQNYFDMYKQYYNYTQEQFLEQNGFSSYEAFLDYLKLDHRRNKYLDKYVEDGLKDKEINKFYDENVFGDINTQHILVEISTGEENEKDSNKLKDADAKKLAEKIITKLNDGTSWKDIQKKYKDQITFEDLGYQSWDASLEESFMNALKEMDDESYSEEPVKTSYGYHIIYRLDQKKKPSMKDAKEKIVDTLVSEKKAEDANLLYKSLISLRKEKNIKFNDTVMKEKYEDYCKQYKNKK